jgi:hypothetical protein
MLYYLLGVEMVYYNLIEKNVIQKIQVIDDGEMDDVVKTVRL